MADPIYLVHALVTAALFVMGMLLIADGILEGEHPRPPKTPG
jgi:hypothetical protein